MSSNKKPSKRKRPDDLKGTVARIWRYLSIQKGWLFLVIVMVVFSSGFSLLGPYLTSVAIDNYLVPGELEGLPLILGLLV
ncbi:hypothetical protein R0J91_18740, partial [Micrococcus sp. SIMBA_131]